MPLHGAREDAAGDASLNGSAAHESGQITILMVTFFCIALVIIMIAIDASLVFLGRQRLASAVDGAAVRAAQQVDESRYYDGECVNSLPLDESAIAKLLAAYSTDGVEMIARPTSAGGPGVVVTGRLVVQLPKVPVIKLDSYVVTYRTTARSSITGTPCGELG